MIVLDDLLGIYCEVAVEDEEFDWAATVDEELDAKVALTGRLDEEFLTLEELFPGIWSKLLFLLVRFETCESDDEFAELDFLLIIFY